MPAWIYPLMLVITLAGYVFLFLQGRLIRRGQERLERRMDEWERALLKSHQSPAPPRQEVVDLGPVLHQLEKLESQVAARFADLQQAQEMLALDAVAKVREIPSMEVESSGNPAHSPEDLARSFLRDEGFTNIVIHRAVEGSGGTRVLLRASRGAELRQGHVLIHDDKVTGASLEVPTSIFP